MLSVSSSAPFSQNQLVCVRPSRRYTNLQSCLTSNHILLYIAFDQPRGLVVRASGYKSQGPGFDSRLYHGDSPCGGRLPVVTMVCVVSRIRFKVETSLTRSHISINNWLNPRQRSPRWRGPHHERQPAHQLIEHPSTLIADYGRKKYIAFYIHMSREDKFLVWILASILWNHSSRGWLCYLNSKIF